MSKLHEAVHKKFDEIVERKGLPTIKGASNTDAALYSLYCVQNAKSFFTKKQKDLMDQLQSESFFDEKNVPVGGAGIVATGKAFTCMLKINNPSRTLDKEALKVTLQKRFKLSAEEANKLILSCTKENNPSKHYEVLPKD